MVQMSLPECVVYVEGTNKMGGMKNQAIDKKEASREAARTKATADGWIGFVNIELSEAQKPLVRALASDPARLWDNLMTLVDAGYKLSVALDTYNNSYNVSMTCKNDRDKNKGRTLTGRGGSVAGAMASFWFKHDAILEGDWSGHDTRTGAKAADDFVG